MLPGHTLRSRYKIIKQLGSGSFGITYLAEDLDLPDHPLCVVKNLRQTQSYSNLQATIAFFNKEAKALYRLGNECSQIPRLFAHFEERGEFFLVQEYINGHDLSQEIFSGNKLSEAKVTQLLKEILEVLTIIHNKNIIHRDIKAQNLMRRHSDGKIILIDFGAVKEISSLKVNPQEITKASIVVGTSGYMPVEQLNGYPRLCSDVYAVGMLGIYALTGIRPQELPKDPNTFDVIWRGQASVSPFLANVLDKMVRFNFNERYQTAGEALQALTTLTPTSKFTLPQALTPASPISPPPHFFAANQRLFIGAGVLASLLFGMGLLFKNTLIPKSEPPTLVTTPKPLLIIAPAPTRLPDTTPTATTRRTTSTTIPRNIVPTATTRRTRTTTTPRNRVPTLISRRIRPNTTPRNRVPTLTTRRIRLTTTPRNRVPTPTTRRTRITTTPRNTTATATVPRTRLTLVKPRNTVPTTTNP